MRIATDFGWLDARVVPGPPQVAVLWHSMFTDSRSWDRVVDDLRKHRTLVLVDGWSFGASADLDHVVDNFNDRCVQGAIAVVSQVHNELAPGPVDWLGSAWGGHVGLQLAATRPDLVRSLITVSTPVQAPGAAMRRQVRMLLPVYRAIGMRGPVRQGLLDGMLTDLTQRTDPEAVDALVAPMSRANRGAIARTVQSRLTDYRFCRAQRVSVLSGVVRRVGLVDYLLNPATRLMVIAMITAPKTNEIRACRRTVVRMVPLPMSVSETWNVIPTVKAM
jgi:pimeloyl-ACP methyl ester carboxylesterase